MPLSKIQFRPGVNRETTSYGDENGWYNSDLVRFRKGRPEKMGGWTRLRETDWVVIRKFDVGTEIPTEIQNHRDAVRAKGTEMESAVAAKSDISSVDSYNIVWPVLGD